MVSGDADRENPYASPTSSTDESAGAILPLAGRARLATIFLWITVGILAISLQISIVGAALGGLPSLESRGMYEFADASGCFEWLGLLVVLATVTSVLLWQHRALSRLHHLGRATSIGPGLAVAAWFVPLVQLVVPFGSMSELWRASRARASEVESELHVWIWWGAWNLSFLGVVAWNGRMIAAVSTLPTLVYWGLFFLVYGAALVAGLLLLRVVREVTEGQSVLEGAAG